MIADKVSSSTSMQDSDSWEPIEFDPDSNESIKPAIISSTMLSGISSVKKLEELDAKITHLEETLARQNEKTVTQMERLVKENLSLKSSTKKLEDLDSKITHLGEMLARQNENTVIQMERLMNEVMSLKDIISIHKKTTNNHFKNLKDKAVLDRIEIIGNIKDVKKEIQTLDDKRSEVLEDLEDLLDEARSSFHSFKTKAEILSLILNNRNILSSLIKSRERRLHDFGPLQQGWSHGCHGRVCSHCGIVQLYGRKYGRKRGSKKIPGYQKVDECCIPSSVNVSSSK